MKSIPYSTKRTNEKLTAQSGLMHVINMMDQLDFASVIDAQLPAPRSNREFPHSTPFQTLILMQHAGMFHLDDVRRLRDDAMVRLLLDTKLPCPQTLGVWLRRMGKVKDRESKFNQINQCLLQASLNTIKKVTVDIDASQIVAHKKDARWTYTGERGYMPMIGTIAETDQVVAVEFRDGNIAPATNNRGFLSMCEQSLPEGVQIQRVRIDAAGYQKKVIAYCQTKHIDFLIRARMDSSIKDYITHASENAWNILKGRDGRPVNNQWCMRSVHVMSGDTPEPFTLVIQRTRKRGQMGLNLSEDERLSDEIEHGGYIYRAIATSCDDLSDSQIVHLYNQRGETSENRIKELKCDFGGDTLPCGDFQANALYFTIVAIAYNLFALLRDCVPGLMGRRRARSVRPLFYWVPAKIVRSGKRLVMKLNQEHLSIFNAVKEAISQLRAPPSPSPA